MKFIFLEIDWSSKLFLELAKKKMYKQVFFYTKKPVLQIQTLPIWIRIQRFESIRIRPSDPDPDPYRFKEVMYRYLKQYFITP